MEQGTDAMYDFVLKLNLATSKGKELFMKKWAIGRMANGESITPREGYKFLQSLGIDVQKVSVGLVGLVYFLFFPAVENFGIGVFFFVHECCLHNMIALGAIARLVRLLALCLFVFFKFQKVPL